MYTVGVRDSLMIAHSFQGKDFGPAQGLHGATYTVDCEFRAANLQPGLNWYVVSVFYPLVFLHQTCI